MVYEARQVSLNRRVALKVLRFGVVADREAMGRFQREAETVAHLHHTNIVPIFARGNQHGVSYYAMQFIEGTSLAAVMQESQQSGKPLGAVEVARWGLQAAEAMVHAHQRGVIHRDIKPSNLLLDPDGRIWLTDFGLAKRIDDVSLSMAGAMVGTAQSPTSRPPGTSPRESRWRECRRTGVARCAGAGPGGPRKNQTRPRSLERPCQAPFVMESSFSSTGISEQVPLEWNIPHRASAISW